MSKPGNKKTAAAAPPSAAPGDADAHERLRFNHRLAAAALGLQAPAPAVAAVLAPPGAAAPLEELLLSGDPQVDARQLQALLAGVLARGAGMRVPAYRALRRLRLLDVPVGDGGASAVAEVLRDGCVESIAVRLAAVELVACGLGVDGARAVGDALVLGANASLASLSLDLNGGVGDAGCVALCRGLASNNRRLTTLSLRYCGVSFPGADAVARVLASPLCVLTSVDLSGNPLGAPGLAALAAAAMGSASLQQLLLADTGVGAGHLLPQSRGCAIPPLPTAPPPPPVAAVPAPAPDASATAAPATAEPDAAAPPGAAAASATGDAAADVAPPAAAAAAAAEAAAAEAAAAAAAGAAATSSGRGEPAAAVSPSDWTRAALALLGAALADARCPLSRVRIDACGVAAADAQVLLPYVGRDLPPPRPKVVDELYVDETLPRALFVALERTRFGSDAPVAAAAPRGAGAKPVKTGAKR